MRTELCSSIAVENNVASVVTDEGIQILIAIDIYQSRGSIVADISQAKVAGRGLGKGNRCGRTSVFEKGCFAITGANEGVEISVFVDIH